MVFFFARTWGILLRKASKCSEKKFVVSFRPSTHRPETTEWLGTRKYSFNYLPTSDKLLLRLRIGKNMHESGEDVTLDTRQCPQVTINDDMPDQADSDSQLPLFLLALLPPKECNSYDTHLVRWDPKTNLFAFFAVTAKKVSLKRRPYDLRKVERVALVAQVHILNWYVSSFMFYCLCAGVASACSTRRGRGMGANKTAREDFKTATCKAREAGKISQVPAAQAQPNARSESRARTIRSKIFFLFFFFCMIEALYIRRRRLSA